MNLAVSDGLWNHRFFLICGGLAPLLLTSTTILAQTQDQFDDEESSASASSSFRLTFDPPEVIRDVTRDIRLNCVFSGRVTSQLKRISRVRLLKKSTSGWAQLAETRWYNMSVRRRHRPAASGAHWVLLKFRWNEARENIFGMYRCDLIGFDKAGNKFTESSAEVELYDVDLTNYLIGMKAEHTREINQLKKKIAYLENELLFQGVEVGSVKEDLVTLETNVDGRLANLSVQDIPGAALNTDLLLLKTDVELANSIIITNKNDIRSCHRELSSLNSSFADQLDQVKDDIEYLESDTAAMFSNLTVGDISGAVSENTVQSITENIALLGGDIYSVNENLSSLTQSLRNDLHTVEKDMVLLQEDVKSIYENASRLSQYITKNSGNISALHETVQSLQGIATSLKQKAVSQQADLDHIEDELDKIDNSITPLRTDLKSVDGVLSRLQKNISSNFRQLSNLQRDLTLTKDNYGLLDGKLSTLSSRVSSLDNAGDSISKELTSLKKGVSTVKEDTASISKNLSSVSSSVSLLQKEMNSKHSELAPLRTDIASAKDTSSATKKAITDLKAKFSALEGNVSGIKGDVTSFRHDYDTMKKKVSTLQTGLSSVQTKYNSLNSGLSSVKRQATSFKNSVSSLNHRINSVSSKQSSLERSLASMKSSNNRQYRRDRNRGRRRG
ncbi:chromosome segregation protein [Elysia marginata]|uniref:Chromosome segregation protein n=1 Tax=Elysia marginata TaxID=1093978 RepID=A0AAV4J1W5_9GAST|nr:chromosome segregation protein [Elysia marginata]